MLQMCIIHALSVCVQIDTVDMFFLADLHVQAQRFLQSTENALRTAMF
jgi:hypothetical protein